MAEPEFVTQDQLRTLLAEMRQDMAEFKQAVSSDLNGIRLDLAQLETRLVRWMLLAAALGGIFGGIIGVVRG